MNRRYRIYVAVIALLAVVNAGRWLLHAGAAQPAARERMLLAEDFRLRLDTPGMADHGRDLFMPGAGASGSRSSGESGRTASHASKPATKAVLQVQPDPARLESENGLGRLRLLGVVFHGGKRQAYLARDKESSIVAAGDTVFGQYAVDEITVDAVKLRDTRTNMIRRIPVSGK